MLRLKGAYMKDLSKDLPLGWQCYGKGLNVPINERDLDLLHISSPGESVFIDIAWFPDYDPNGSYVCRYVKNNNWENPEDVLYTEFSEEVSLQIVVILNSFMI
jgi:hypothetical protein